MGDHNNGCPGLSIVFIISTSGRGAIEKVWRALSVLKSISRVVVVTNHVFVIIPDATN